MTNNTLKKALWWLCLLVAPGVLITIELFHPAGFTQNPGMYEYLQKPEPYNPQFSALGYFGPQWWFTLHMIQTPMVGLVAVGLWLLADKAAGDELRNRRRKRLLRNSPWPMGVVGSIATT